MTRSFASPTHMMMTTFKSRGARVVTCSMLQRFKKMLRLLCGWYSIAGGFVRGRSKCEHYCRSRTDVTQYTAMIVYLTHDVFSVLFSLPP